MGGPKVLVAPRACTLSAVAEKALAELLTYQALVVEAELLAVRLKSETIDVADGSGRQTHTNEDVSIRQEDALVLKVRALVLLGLVVGVRDVIGYVSSLPGKLTDAHDSVLLKGAMR